MKKISVILVFILLIAKVSANDTACILNFGSKNITTVTKVKNMDWMKLNAIKSNIALMDSKINFGSEKTEDYFYRGALKQAIEDNYGALKDFSKVIELNNKHFGALVNRSTIYLKQKKFADALKDMNILMETYPDSAILYNNRGFLFQLEKKYEDAIKDYNKAWELDKNYITPLKNKFECYIQLKKKKEARATCNDLQRINSKDPRMYMAIANFFVEYKDADSALYYINKAIIVSKNNYEMYIWRSQCNDDLIKNEAEALKDCDTAILLAPKNPQTYYARARPLFDMKEYQKLIFDCNIAISLDSTLYEIWILRGDAYDLLGNVSASLKDYETAIRMYPFLERAYIEIETLYTSRNDNKNGIKALDRLLKIDPANEMGLLHRGKLLLETKDFSKAEKDFSALAKIAPESSMAWYYWALSLDSLGKKENVCKYMKISCDLDQEEEQFQHALTESHVYLIDNCRDLIPAEKLKGDDFMRELLKAEKISNWSSSILILDKFLETFPDSAFFYYMRGKNKRKVGKFEEAIVDYKKGLKLNPNIPDAWISLGVAQQRLERNNEAMESYKQAIKVAPDNEMPYNNIGAILTDDKKYAEAIPYFKKAIAIKPDYVTAIRQLAECYEGIGDKSKACITYRRAEALGDGASISKRMFNCN